MFSDSFSEGQERDINDGFPSDSDPYAEHYDYLSDSDLEDESSLSEEEDGSSCSDEEDEEPLEGKCDSQERLEGGPGPEMSQTVDSNLPSSVNTTEAPNGHRSAPSTIGSLTNLVTPITDLTIISRERVKLPSSEIWRP